MGEREILLLGAFNREWRRKELILIEKGDGTVRTVLGSNLPSR
jgi:hypothetical protein